MSPKMGELSKLKLEQLNKQSIIETQITKNKGGVIHTLR